MLFNLFLISPLHSNSDESPPPKKQSAKTLDEQDNSSAHRHHQDAVESLRQFKQRYHLDRTVF